MNKTADRIAGRVYVVGDNIDTDQIIPAEYLNLVPTIPAEYDELGSHALAGLPDNYPPFIEKGARKSKYTIVVAGCNFGCGSSREHAPVALAASGVRVVVAQSFARIFFRNAVATGVLYPIETEQTLRDIFRTDDEAEVDVSSLLITGKAAGNAFRLKDLGAVAPVIRAGGIFAYARATGMIPKRNAG